MTNDGGDPSAWMERERDNLGQFRIIQAEQRFRAVDRWLNDFEAATWPEVKTFIRSYHPPGPMAEALFQKVRDWSAKDIPPYKVKEDGRTLEDELSLAAMEYRTRLDPLSFVGSIVPPFDMGDSLEFDILNDAVWLDPFEGSGGFLVIVGPPRKGKTGIACHVIAAWLRRDPRAIVLSNIIFERTPDRVIEVPRVSALAEEAIKAVKEHRKWLWVFDDAGLEWIKQRAMAGTAIDLEQFARIVPKHGGSFVYIDQRAGGVPTTISEFAESRVRAIRPGFASVSLPRLRGFVRDIPKPDSDFPYISEARSAFIVDVDIRKSLIEGMPRPTEPIV